MTPYYDGCGRRGSGRNKDNLCPGCARLKSDNPSKNMAFPKGDCPKCGRVAMQTQWYTGKKYCPICDAGDV